MNRALVYKCFLVSRNFVLFQNRFHCWSNSVLQQIKSEDINSFNELQIPIDYGYLAAKEYGPEKSNKVIALHGWQDNAGTFDTLIPLLSPNFHIIVPDQAGHGLSSHKPLGYPYYYLDYVNNIKVIANYFKWKKFSILSHSIGFSFAIIFAGIYPEMINKIISIDLLKPTTYSPQLSDKVMRENINQYLKLEEKLKNRPSVYSEEEALQHFIKNRNGAVSEESAKILMKRGLKWLTDKNVIFSSDIRIKAIWDNELRCKNILKAIISNVRCHLLIIKAKELSRPIDEESLNEFLELYRINCKTFKLIEVEGNHFVHLNNPECIASIVNSFLLNTK